MGVKEFRCATHDLVTAPICWTDHNGSARYRHEKFLLNGWCEGEKVAPTPSLALLAAPGSLRLQIAWLGSGVLHEVLQNGDAENRAWKSCTECGEKHGVLKLLHRCPSAKGRPTVGHHAGTHLPAESRNE
jgi:hypothetical protein